MTNLTDLEFPADLDQLIEAALETLRAQLNDPIAPPPVGQMIGIAMSTLDQLLAKVSPGGHDLAEAGILLQAVALKTVIYYVSTFTPGDWFHETTTDIKRALAAIELLVVIAKAEDTKAEAAEQQNTKANV